MESRPTKRVRQACKPCQRKKSRCPGERPTCSFCARLKQSCHYADEWNSPCSASTVTQNKEQQISSAYEQRLGTLEAKLDLVLNKVLSQPTQLREHLCESTQNQRAVDLPPASTTSAVPSTDSVPTHENRDKSFTQRNSLPPHIIQGLVDIYIRCCDCQPLSIFDVELLRHNLNSFNPEVLSSILALSLRFSEALQIPGDFTQLASEYAERTRQIVMEKIMGGNTEMTTLQALCLNAFYDLTNGSIQRAWLSIGIGIRLITSIQIPLKSESVTEQGIIDEYRRCLWGFYLLECICSDASTVYLSLPHDRPPYPPSVSVKSEYGTHKFQPSFGDYASPAKTQDKGIIGYFFQLVELWKRVLQYVVRSLDVTESPWSPGSEYADMSALVMEWESLLCKNHRSAHAMFSEQSPTDLLINSRYWAPWLNVQFTYHCTISLINNPFYLLSKVLSNNGVASTSFLETASDLSLLHAKHIARLVETLKDRQFETTDPFLGHCVAVAAMTHLWYCKVEGREVKEQAQKRFVTCYNFVTRLGKKWPIVQIIADNLTHLNKISQSWEPFPTSPLTPLKIPAADLPLVWNLLSYPPRDCTQAQNISKGTSPPSIPSSTVTETRNVLTLKQSQTPTGVQSTDCAAINSIMTSNIEQCLYSKAPETRDRSGNGQSTGLDDFGFDIDGYLLGDNLESGVDWSWYSVGNL